MSMRSASFCGRLGLRAMRRRSALLAAIRGICQRHPSESIAICHCQIQRLIGSSGAVTSWRLWMMPPLWTNLRFAAVYPRGAWRTFGSPHHPRASATALTEPGEGNELSFGHPSRQMYGPTRFTIAALACVISISATGRTDTIRDSFPTPFSPPAAVGLVGSVDLAERDPRRSWEVWISPWRDPRQARNAKHLWVPETLAGLFQKLWPVSRGCLRDRLRGHDASGLTVRRA